MKDTAANIRLTEEFTVNIVGHARADAMNVCAIAFGPEVDELAAAGLTAAAGEKASCPRIGEAPVALECRRHVTLELGRARAIILGKVLAVHVREDIVDGERLCIDQQQLDGVGRMGGHGYVTTRDFLICRRSASSNGGAGASGSLDD